MGTWSASVTANDLAQNLKSEYAAAFYYYDVQTALQKIESYVRKEICDESDKDEWCSFFYSLADFMWKKGILTEEIKQRTIDMIDKGWGLGLWEESGKAALNARKKVLAKFREQLLSPMPDNKKLSKPNLYLRDIFETGDLIAIQLQTADKQYTCGDRKPMSDKDFHAMDGKYVLVQKIRCKISYTSSVVPEVKNHWAVFRLLNGVYDAVPENVNIAALRDARLQHSTPLTTVPTPLFYCESSMFCFKKRKYKLIGNFPQQAAAYQALPCDPIYLGMDRKWYNADSLLLASMASVK